MQWDEDNKMWWDEDNEATGIVTINYWMQAQVLRLKTLKQAFSHCIQFLHIKSVLSTYFTSTYVIIEIKLPCRTTTQVKLLVPSLRKHITSSLVSDLISSPLCLEGCQSLCEYCLSNHSSILELFSAPCVTLGYHGHRDWKSTLDITCLWSHLWDHLVKCPPHSRVPNLTYICELPCFFWYFHYIQKGWNTTLVTIQKNRLYHTRITPNDQKEAAHATVDINLLYWYMGHVSPNQIQQMIKSGQLPKIDTLSGTPTFCEAYTLGKMKKLPFELQDGPHTTHPLEMVHTDVGGPITPITQEGHRYWIVIIDDFTCFPWVYFMKHKSKALGIYNQWRTDIKFSFILKWGEKTSLNPMSSSSEVMVELRWTKHYPLLQMPCWKSQDFQSLSGLMQWPLLPMLLHEVQPP